MCRKQFIKKAYLILIIIIIYAMYTYAIFVSDCTIHFSNWCDSHKAAKVVHENQSITGIVTCLIHCCLVTSNTTARALLATTLFLSLSKHTQTHTHTHNNNKKHSHTHTHKNHAIMHSQFSMLVVIRFVLENWSNNITLTAGI